MPNLTTSSFPTALGAGALIKRLVGTLVVAAVVVGGSYAAWTVYSQNNTKLAKTSAQNFISDVALGNTTGAYALTSANIQRNTTEAQFEQGFSTFAATTPKYLTESLKSTNKNTAVFTAALSGITISGTGSANTGFTLGLIRVGSSWQVDSVNIQ